MEIKEDNDDGEDGANTREASARANLEGLSGKGKGERTKVEGEGDGPWWAEGRIKKPMTDVGNSIGSDDFGDYLLKHHIWFLVVTGPAFLD